MAMESQIAICDLQIKINELASRQYELDSTISCLKKEKRELEESSQVKMPSPETAPHYRYIYPLVEEIYLLELKEKELKEQYHDKRLSLEARHLGQQLLSASFMKDETVLEIWYKELQDINNTQPPLSTTSAESQDYPTVHNVVYNCKHNTENLVEDLAMTVLCQAVHARLKIHSVLPCPNIHFFSAGKAEITLSCDNHIPGLEEFVLLSLERDSSIKGVISKIGDYISSDMAPFVISIPMKKKGRKKKKEIVNQDVSAYPQESNECET